MNDELKNLSAVVAGSEGKNTKEDIPKQENIQRKIERIEEAAQKVLKGRREETLKLKIIELANELDDSNYFKDDCIKAFKSANFLKISFYYSEEFISDRKYILADSANWAVKKLKESEGDVSFWKIFKQRFYFTVLNIVLDKIKEENDYVRNEEQLVYIKDLLKNVLHEKIKDKILAEKYRRRINNWKYINKDKLENFILNDLKGDEKDISKLRSYFKLQVIKFDKKIENEEGETVTVGEFIAYDKQQNVLAMRSEKDYLLNKAEFIERRLAALSNDSLRIYLKALLSVVILQHESRYGHDIELDDYIDKDFESYYKTRDYNIKFDDILSDYLKKKKNTVRKYPRTLKEQLCELKALTSIIEN